MIVVLGGNGGIGGELVSAMCKHDGVQVLGAFREDCNVQEEDSVAKFFSNLNRVSVAPGAPLYVVNATGHLANGLCHKFDEDNLIQTLDVNVAGSYRVAKHFRTAAKTRPGSSLVLLSSVVGRLGVSGASAYGAAKSAIHGMVRGLSKEFALIGARVNAIEMGYFDRGMIDRIPDDQCERIRESIPLKRFGSVPELSDMTLAILANEYMTGAVVPLTGGL